MFGSPLVRKLSWGTDPFCHNVPLPSEATYETMQNPFRQTNRLDTGDIEIEIPVKSPSYAYTVCIATLKEPKAKNVDYTEFQPEAAFAAQPQLR